MRILLAGSFAATPDQGGAAWAVLQYALGFERLGHDVLLVEPAPPRPAYGACFRDTLQRAGFAGRAALVHGDRQISGVSWSALTQWAADADLLVNLGGALKEPELLELVALRLYVDLDPCFTQFWHTFDAVDMGLTDHHRFATVGQAVGTAGCVVPTCGVEWIPTVPPVVLDCWPPAGVSTSFGLTTVANWRSYGSIHCEGIHYGQKAHAFRALLGLPALVPAVDIEPALAIHAGEYRDLELLAAHGWKIHDPATVTSDHVAYRRFVRSSTAELGVAKSGYTLSGCAWFSDRSVCYLASGRPVIAQDTGWSSFLPAGEGLLAFSDSESAAAAVDEVLSNYGTHRRAARALAEEHFDARTVLGALLERVGP